MMNNFREFFYRYSNVCFLCICLMCLCSGMLIPRLLMPKPVINMVMPNTIMVNSVFNDDRSLWLEGENFEDIIAVYVNGAWERRCNIISKTDDSLQIILPSEYYKNEAELSIQIQTKINSDLFGMSNKKKVIVLSDDSIATPKINTVELGALNFKQEFSQKITVTGENFNEESVVTLNGTELTTTYKDNTLVVSVPFSVWYKEDIFKLGVVQYYGGNITAKKSPGVYLDIEPYMINTDNETESREQNHQFLLSYLEMLKNSDYLIIFSVKDESSNAMTDEISIQLNSMGLKGSLLKSGFRKSYIAILDGSYLVHEEIGTEALVYDDKWYDIDVHVESANYEAGNFSIIQLDGIEYSVNNTGLNIVVYDKNEGRVIDSVCFDTYEDLSLEK